MIEYIYEHVQSGADHMGKQVELPTLVQREEIVRCRDCCWAKPDQSDHDYRGEYRCNMWIADVSADGYCWRGMRKEGGDGLSD